MALAHLMHAATNGTVVLQSKTGAFKVLKSGAFLIHGKAAKASDFAVRQTSMKSVAQQCPYAHGSDAAKMWWKHVVVPEVRAGVTPENQAKYGKSLTGMFEGKPLRPGANPGDGDFNYLREHAMVTQGVSHTEGTNIAGHVNKMLYG